MPELRQNLILKEWVVISTERAKRPEQLREERDIDRSTYGKYDENCPFCPGNEEKFGNDEVLYREDDEKGNWKLKILPNKFPALTPAGANISVHTEGNFRLMDGVGHHEVLIEHSCHHQTIATMEVAEVYRVLKAYRMRMKILQEISYVESVITFRNHGTRAGASLIHPHSQFIALPIIPKDMIARINESIRYHQEHRECIFCRVMNSELENYQRIVMETTHFVAFVPYAAYSPFHIWIYPKRHSSSFLDVTNEELHDMASILRGVLKRLFIGLNDPDYNYIIRTAPKGYYGSDFFHWYLTIVPRLTRTAGFELGSGMFINPSIPEENAEYLRGIQI